MVVITLLRGWNNQANLKDTFYYAISVIDALEVRDQTDMDLPFTDLTLNKGKKSRGERENYHQ
jgi:hypothetical protein